MSSPRPDSTPGSAVQYVYMFEKDKGPTKQLDALLRAIARHVILEIGDKADANLTPSKLAAFYKAVGGNYDSLFVNMPHPSISYMWQVTGCQHSLQPTGDDFEAPSLPALTYRGFSRWESLELLLGPEEHVPFLQYAVRNWNLKHPDTGEFFPTDLPSICFPAQADKEVDRWHKACSAKLKTAAANDGKASSGASKNDKPEPKFVYTHVRDTPTSASSPRFRYADGEYFGRPVSYAHIPRQQASQHKAERSPDRPHHGMTAEDRARRKSFSDYAFGLQPDSDFVPSRGYSSSYLGQHLKGSSQARRHSHPRQQSSDSSADDPTPDHGEKRRRHPNASPPPSVRRFARNSGASQAHGSSSGNGNLRPRLDGRMDGAKGRHGPSPLSSFRDRLSETVSSILPNGLNPDRPRPGSRQNSGAGTIRSRRSREQLRPSHLHKSYSDMDSDDSEDPVTTEGDAGRRRRMREDREREDGEDRDWERERHHRGRARDHWDAEREPELRRDKNHLRRPDNPRRCSSHADIDRQREPPEWNTRDRNRERERERLREERSKWSRRPSREFESPAAFMASRQVHPEAAYS